MYKKMKQKNTKFFHLLVESFIHIFKVYIFYFVAFKSTPFELSVMLLSIN